MCLGRVSYAGESGLLLQKSEYSMPSVEFLSNPMKSFSSTYRIEAGGD